MTLPTVIDPQRLPAAEPHQSLDIPPARHLIHASGCPLYVWWASAKRRNRAGQHWRSWFVYLEYRLSDGASAYVQHELQRDRVDDPSIWQYLVQLPLPGACLNASGRRLIRG